MGQENSSESSPGCRSRRGLRCPCRSLRASEVLYSRRRLRRVGESHSSDAPDLWGTVGGGHLGKRTRRLEPFALLPSGHGRSPGLSRGNNGWDYVTTSPTGGYLIGFVAAAFVTGLLVERGLNRKGVLWALLAGTALIYIPGILWLGARGVVPWESVLSKGLYLYIPGDVLKNVDGGHRAPLGVGVGQPAGPAVVVDVTWMGHSCFRLRSEQAVLVTDPYNPDTLGLGMSDVTANTVTVSHEHPHHDATDRVNGTFRVFRGPGEYEYMGTLVKGVMTPRGEGDAGKKKKYCISY